MTTYVGAVEAARLLEIERPTLYAYVSRGVLRRKRAVDGRSSLFDVDEILALRTRSRKKAWSSKPSIDVQITTAITALDDDGLTFRGHQVVELLPLGFEAVAELLWTGELPGGPSSWEPAVERDVAAVRRAEQALGRGGDPLLRLIAACAALSVDHAGDSPAQAARRLLVTVAGPAPRRRSLADTFTRSWRQRPSQELVAAVGTALVLLADHELATSTLAVRLAASTRTDPYSAFIAGLGVLRGPLHGSSAREVHELLVMCRRTGTRQAVERRLDSGRRLPGFGHMVYRQADPRLAPLLGAVRAIPAAADRIAVVDELLAVAGSRLPRHPNVDLGLGALSFVGGLDADVPIFALARFAGWAAHFDEELRERPLRFRGMARARDGG